MIINKYVQTQAYLYIKNEFDYISYREVIGRELAGATSASHSVVTVDHTTIDAFSTYSVTVTAKDSTDTNIEHGGDTFLIQISNQWTMSDAYNWDVVSGAKTTISPMIFDKMTDNNDGTYSSSFWY